MLIPRQKAPALVVETLGHGRFDLATERPERMTLVCFYRGLHCPICANYLKELDRLIPEFAARGVGTIAIQMWRSVRARWRIRSKPRTCGSAMV
jgi:peroxiredoxin